jgi:hypothetical protein
MAGEILLPYQEHKDGKKEDLFDTMHDMPTICFGVSAEGGLYMSGSSYRPTEFCGLKCMVFLFVVSAAQKNKQ